VQANHIIVGQENSSVSETAALNFNQCSSTILSPV